jgi:hypothetical protein
MEVKLHTFFTSLTCGDEWSVSPAVGLDEAYKINSCPRYAGNRGRSVIVLSGTGIHYFRTDYIAT